MDGNIDLIVLGEGLIELSSNAKMGDTKDFSMYYGGDTLAAAVTARRMGTKTGYITKIGNDYFKDYLLNRLQEEDIEVSQIKLAEDANNGLYLLARPENSEKEYAYYRKKTAATKISIEDISREYFEKAKCFYTSGITQSLSLSVREAVKRAYALSKEIGIQTAYDPNFSPLIISKEEAAEFFEEVNDNIDILFLNDRNDMMEIIDKASIEETIKYCSDLGIQITVIKSFKNRGYYTGYAGDIIFTPYVENHDIIDTTSAGDAFNGGFLHAVLSGYTPFDAAKFASAVSGLQARGMGAIKSIPSREEVEAQLGK